MRFKNFGTEMIRVPVKAWVFPRLEGPLEEGVSTFTVNTTMTLSKDASYPPTIEMHDATDEGGDDAIVVTHLYEPGEVSEDFDPDDPIVQVLLRAHPDLRPYEVPSVWDRLKNER